MHGPVIARGRDWFQNGGEINISSEQTRPEVLASWLRCRDQYQVDPTRKVGEVRTPPSDNSQLHRVAEPVLDALLPTITASEHLLLLSDEHGQLLRVDGYRPLVRRVANRNIVVGSVWDEATAGTNGIGTALENGRSFEVVQGEHFCEGWQDLTCTGGLVRHPITGRAAGVVDVTGYRTLPQPHTLAMIESTARLIEYEWAARILQRSCLILDVYLTAATHYRHQPIVAFDMEGYMIRASAPACTLLALDPVLMAQQSFPREAAPAVAAEVVDDLKTVTPGDLRAHDVTLSLPAVGRPLSAALMPVVRDGQVLGGVAIISGHAIEGGPLAPGSIDAPTGQSMRPLNHLVARTLDGRLVLMDVHEIAYARADGRGVWLHTANEMLRSTYPTLQALAGALSSVCFFQANRSDLVNVSWVTEIEPVLEHSFDLILRDPPRTRIPVSRRRLSRLRELLHF